MADERETPADAGQTPANVREIIEQADQAEAQGRLDDAERLFRAAVEQSPERISPRAAAIDFFNRHRRFEDALPLAERAVRMAPRDGRLWWKLATALFHLKRPKDAAHCYMRADQALGGVAEARQQVAACMRKMGDARAGLDALQRAGAKKPDSALIGSDWVLTSLHLPEAEPGRMRTIHEAWAKRYCGHITPREHTPVAGDADRPIRIGLISPRFREHVVTYLLEPTLRERETPDVELFGYSDVPDATIDDATRRMKTYCDQWCSTWNTSDSDLADRIMADRIDVLVELNVHLPPHRLPTLAARPAPVQATYLGYNGSTGLATVDWRFTDPVFDPPSEDASRHGPEKPLVLPGSYWVYHQTQAAPEPAPPPFQKNGYVTFGSTNDAAKISEPCLAAWAEVLKRLPESKLLIVAEGGPEQQPMLPPRLEKLGIPRERFEIVARRDYVSYFQLYELIDVLLDTFPYAGGTTTMDSLWQGVPVVTCRQDRLVGRGSASVLHQLARTDWVCDDVDSYVDTAVRLAGDTERLAHERTALRPDMKASPLCDGRAHAKQFFDACRFAWRQWCTAGA